LARRPAWPPLAGAAMALAAQTLTHLPTAWLSLLITGCWALYVRLSDRSTGRIGRWGGFGLAVVGAFVLALALSIVQLWPMLEILPFSTRGAMSLSEAHQYALPTPLLLGMVLPMSLAFPEWVTYVGVVTLAIAPASLFARHSTQGLGFFITLILLGTLLSLELARPLYSILFRVLPGMQWLRFPTRIFFVIQLAWAFMAGIGWESLRKMQWQRRFPLIGWWSGLALLVTIGAGWTHWFPNILAVPAATVVAALVTLVVLTLVLRTGRFWAEAAAVLAALIILESLSLTSLFMDRGYTSTFSEPTSQVIFLKEQQGPFRSYSTSASISLAQAVEHGLETVDGRDPFQLDYYRRWMNTASGCNLPGYAVSVPACASAEINPEAYLRALPDATLLGIGNVRYVVATHSLDEWSGPVWQSGSVRVYENGEVLPPVFVVPNVVIEPDDAAALAFLRESQPKKVAVVTNLSEARVTGSIKQSEAQLISRRPNQSEIQAEGPGWLVVSDVWAPGWRAMVDGMPAQVYRTNVAFCGIALGSGAHTITLTYAPIGWIWGRWISLAAAAIVVMITTIWYRQRRRDRPGSDAQSDLR
jgi:hypothetical protein